MAKQRKGFSGPDPSQHPRSGDTQVIPGGEDYLSGAVALIDGPAAFGYEQGRKRVQRYLAGFRGRVAECLWMADDYRWVVWVFVAMCLGFSSAYFFLMPGISPENFIFYIRYFSGWER
ncbi:MULTISPECIES: hypothetical protein [Halomonadaceae]|uniref:Uncharacterized protein n=1 Tax=Billgrantia aerodenitrificans TaxID=2733483 RepID=A0ABS9AQD4_9GAMM|nr:MULTISPECIES: hypothetical protein [Halomonas]MCE8023857.1 hypothetical protein [Halomonas aerodenitrificans]